eukprot:CAMPEP_0173433804 /NCGR_PEP_ID=MMETSP1357-20121228/11111_1 /TAXON_ID=77926 /ORGANISM="Hemiselmis rufescens, Strain PCC563" /LENGTH=255 /DNA_ID=CAMNT_0014398543 /DNA_START=33 /DNA_END=797 /DNA_ORIENTATION=-
MATLMEFAAMQLERETGTRSSFPEDAPADARPASVFWSLSASDSLSEHSEADGAKSKAVKATTLVVGCFGAGASSIESLLPDDSVEQLGLIILPELSVRGCRAKAGNKQQGLCALWRSTSDTGLVFCNVSHNIPPERATAFSRALLSSVVADRTIVVDTAHARDFGFSLEELGTTCVKSLSTTSERDAGRSPSAKDTIPPGGLVTGVAAATVAMCEVRGRSASLHVAVTPDDGSSHSTDAVIILASTTIPPGGLV